MRYSTRYLVMVAVIASLSVVVMWFQFPLIPAAPYLQYDFSDVPVLIGAFSLGPLAGFFIATVKALIFLFTKSESGIIGSFMNWSSTAFFVVPAAWFYFKVKKNRLGALLGMALGTVIFTVVMVFVNIYIALPLWGIPTEQIKPLITSAVIPFNLLRGVISTISTFLIYEKVSPLIKRLTNI